MSVQLHAFLGVAMIGIASCAGRYVEEEVKQVKEMYDTKLKEVGVERDKALEELEALQQVETYFCSIIELQSSTRASCSQESHLLQKMNVVSVPIWILLLHTRRAFKGKGTSSLQTTYIIESHFCFTRYADDTRIRVQLRPNNDFYIFTVSVNTYSCS